MLLLVTIKLSTAHPLTTFLDGSILEVVKVRDRFSCYSLGYGSRTTGRVSALCLSSPLYIHLTVDVGLFDRDTTVQGKLYIYNMLKEKCGILEINKPICKKEATELYFSPLGYETQICKKHSQVYGKNQQVSVRYEIK